MEMYYLATVLPFLVCLFWTVIGLLDYHWADVAKRALTFFGVTATFLYLCHYLHFNGLQSVFSESVYYLCNLSVYPLYMVYVHRLTYRHPHFWRREAPWFVPALTLFVLSLCGVPSLQHIAQWLFPLVSLSAMVDATFCLVRFRKGVDEYYANPGDKRLDPILTLLSLQLVTLCLSVLVNIMGRDAFQDDASLIVPSALFSSLLFCIFYIGGRTTLPVPEVQYTHAEPENESINEQQKLQLMERIESQMRERQLFLTKGLTVADLSSIVGSNRTYVSHCINQYRQMSFSNYVNGFRVEYAQRLMLEDGSRTLTEIADLSGFMDRSSFYRGFKRATGENPTAWLEAHKA